MAGDYADDAIDAGFAGWGGLDLPYDDDEPDTMDGAVIYRPRCKYCGARGLRWGHHNGGWRLFGTDEKTGEPKLHGCLNRAALGAST